MSSEPRKSIHISFADGSNPYLRYNMTLKEYEKEKRRWSRRFNLVHISDYGTIVSYKAYEKEGK